MKEVNTPRSAMDLLIQYGQIRLSDVSTDGLLEYLRRPRTNPDTAMFFDVLRMRPDFTAEKALTFGNLRTEGGQVTSNWINVLELFRIRKDFDIILLLKELVHSDEAAIKAAEPVLLERTDLRIEQIYTFKLTCGSSFCSSCSNNLEKTLMKKPHLVDLITRVLVARLHGDTFEGIMDRYRYEVQVDEKRPWIYDALAEEIRRRIPTCTPQQLYVALSRGDMWNLRGVYSVIYKELLKPKRLEEIKTDQLVCLVENLHWDHRKDLDKEFSKAARRRDLHALAGI